MFPLISNVKAGTSKKFWKAKYKNTKYASNAITQKYS